MLTATAHTHPSGSVTCVLRLPLPDAASASVVAAVIASDPPIEGTSRTVQCEPSKVEAGTPAVVTVTVEGSGVRAMRAAIGAVLEQTKLSVRTMRVYPPNTVV